MLIGDVRTFKYVYVNVIQAVVNCVAATGVDDMTELMERREVGIDVF